MRKNYLLLGLIIYLGLTIGFILTISTIPAILMFLFVLIPILIPFLLFYYTYENKNSNKLFISSLIGLSFVLYPYITTFFHEMHHALFGKMFGLEIIDIKITYGQGGVFWNNIELPLFQELMLYGSGSIGAMLVNVILLYMVYHNNELAFEFYLPLFSAFSYGILKEIIYWYNFSLDERSDPYKIATLLKIEPEIFKYVSFFFLIITLPFLFVIFIKRLNVYMNNLGLETDNLLIISLL